MILYAATTNRGKLREFEAAAAAAGTEVRPLPGFDTLTAAIEDGATFEANARKKAVHYSAARDELIFAEDSGLEVPALGGAPGVHSARYAGAGASDEDNNRKLLAEMRVLQAPERIARYVCVIALARRGSVIQRFEGYVEGLIAYEPAGSGGFGYDPLFLVPELGRTFAEIAPEEKLKRSHRGQAFRAMLSWLADNAPVR